MEISEFHIPRWEELPNIELYMDQVLNYIEDSLSSYLVTDSDEKIITKTMINNYVKQDIIESPINKKYTKIHIAKLLVICILKQIYSINDIKKLISLALQTSSAQISYNKFCNTLENSLKETFSGKRFSSEKSTEEQYILENVLQCFSNKLYVQIVYLKK